jgi:hypothetical protein
MIYILFVYFKLKPGFYESGIRTLVKWNLQQKVSFFDFLKIIQNQN